MTETFLQRISRLNPTLNAFITITDDEALDQAKQACKLLRRRPHALLLGVPLALKDVFATKGIRTTCGSKILERNVPTYDASTVRMLKDSGAVMLGKLNLHEFALGTTSENPHYGPARNPWDLRMISGGSSGGSAVAVASSLCLGSLGTDTGGSIRIPASLCGIVGLKPTYGRVSRFGVFPLSWTQDHVGILSRTVEDASLILRTIAGKDPKDPTTSDLQVPDYPSDLADMPQRIRVAILKENLSEADDEVQKAFFRATEELEDEGVSLTEVSFSLVDYARAINFIVMACEGYSIHEYHLKKRESDYGSDVRDRLMQGKLITARDYLKAQRLRSYITHEIRTLLKRFDLLVTPTTPITATPIGSTNLEVKGKNKIVRTLLPIFTRLYNVTGLPAISVPCGFSGKGLPIGLQIAGRPFEEGLILKAAYRYEHRTKWYRRHPKL